MRHLRRTIALILLLVLVGGPTAAIAQTSPTSPPAETHAAEHDHVDHDEDHPEHDHDDHADGDHDDEHHDHDDHEHDDAHHDEDHDEDHDHDGAASVFGSRLLVAEANGATLLVLDLATGSELARFGTPGPGTVHQLPDPQLAVVLHPDEDRVTFVHSGLTEVDHGDHADLVEGLPYVLQTLNVGVRPSHVFAAANDLLFANEGDGTVAWFDRRLLGVSLEYAVLDGREPGGVVAVQGGHAYVGYARSGRVDVFDRSGATLATFDGCPGLHGPASWAEGVAFGCSDGVLLVEARPGGTFAAHKVANPPGSPEGARVGTIVGDEGAGVLVGSFGRGIAWIDPVARSLAPLALPASPLAMRFAEAGAVLVVLTADGQLHALDPATGAVLRSVAVVDAVEPGAPRPTMTVLGEHVYVGDPLHAEVVEVHVDALEVERRLPVSVAPGGIAGLAIPGAVGH